MILKSSQSSENLRGTCACHVFGSRHVCLKTKDWHPRVSCHTPGIWHIVVFLHWHLLLYLTHKSLSPSPRLFSRILFSQIDLCPNWNSYFSSNYLQDPLVWHCLGLNIPWQVIVAFILIHSSPFSNLCLWENLTAKRIGYNSLADWVITIRFNVAYML